MQFIAGRLGQEYNRQKSRKGAFWQDRYHATAIESGDPLWRCLVYVDLNMVRAGVVDPPSKWKWSGYPEIQEPKIRYRLIDHSKRLKFLNANSHESLANTHRRWVESQLKTGLERQEHFSRSIAVGSKLFIQKVRKALGAQGIGRRMAKAPEMGHPLKETIAKYGSGDSIQAESDCPKWHETNTVPWRWADSLKP